MLVLKRFNFDYLQQGKVDGLASHYLTAWPSDNQTPNNLVDSF